MSLGITFDDFYIDVFFILVEPGTQCCTDVTEYFVMSWQSRSKDWFIEGA